MGAVDGKHIHVKVPPKSGIDFHNYQGYVSVFLTGVVDFDYYFLYVDVGTPRQASVAVVWRDCAFSKVSYS